MWISIFFGMLIVATNKSVDNKRIRLMIENEVFSLRGETVYVNFLVTISCSLNISVVYFCN